MKDLNFDGDETIATVVQDRMTGTVLASLRLDRRALDRAMGERLLELPESHGVPPLSVHDAFASSEGHAVLLRVDSSSPGSFPRRLVGTGPALIASPAGDEVAGPAVPFLLELERTLESRRHSTAAKSYTSSLLSGGPAAIGAKLSEEAEELSRAIALESTERVASEAADLLYHALVGLLLREVPLRSVVAVLARRFGQSGHAEKASRVPKS